MKPKLFALIGCICIAVGLIAAEPFSAAEWRRKEALLDVKLKEVQAALDVLAGRSDLPAEVKATVGQRMAGRYARFAGGQRMYEIELLPDYTFHKHDDARSLGGWFVTSEGLTVSWTPEVYMVLKPGPLAGTYEGKEVNGERTQSGALMLIQKETGR